jgi:hypothetical protein
LGKGIAKKGIAKKGIAAMIWLAEYEDPRPLKKKSGISILN